MFIYAHLCLVKYYLASVTYKKQIYHLNEHYLRNYLFISLYYEYDKIMWVLLPL